MFVSLIVTFFLLTGAHTGRNSCDNFQFDQFWPNFLRTKSLEYFGSAVAIDKNQNVVILHRSTSQQAGNKNKSLFIHEDVVLILDPKFGMILRTWGKDIFSKPHGIEISEEGDLFITDVRLHQVFKFRYNAATLMWRNQPELVLGEQFVSGSDSSHFCSPADVAVSSQTGVIFIADGYCNSRIITFNRFGSYFGEFGAGTSNPLSPILPFNVTHAVSLAKPTCSKRYVPELIFVADRNNGRVQCFTENGTFLYEIGDEMFFQGINKEMLTSLAFSSRNLEVCAESNQTFGTLYVVNGHLPLGQPKIFELAVSSSTFSLIDSISISESEIVNQVETIPRIQIPHDITVSRDGKSLYVIEAYDNLTVKKFKRGAEDFCGSGASIIAFDKCNYGIIAFISFITFTSGRLNKPTF